jgi:predicted RNA-binding protein associated with RNAse of E/G family
MGNKITIHKRNHTGRTVWSYTGEEIERGDNWICIKARYWGNGPVDIGFMTFEQGDLMTEWFYTDRYYNVFKVQKGDSEIIKGWYCNISRPAEIDADSVGADDLELDVFVSLTGELHLLDEDDYAALKLTTEEHESVQKAIATIRDFVGQRKSPFDAID